MGGPLAGWTRGPRLDEPGRTPPRRPPALCGSEVDLGAKRERIDAIFALVCGSGRADREDARGRGGRNRAARPTLDVNMPVLSHEPHVVDGIPDQARLVTELSPTIHIERRRNRRRAVINSVIEVDVIHAAVDVKGAQTAVIQRMEDLGAIPPPRLVAARFASEIIADFRVTAGEVRVTVERS